MEEAQEERCRQIVRGALARRDWRLVDADALAQRICREIADPVAPSALIERAVVRQYCHVLHAACGERDVPARQNRAFIELHCYLYSIALHKTRDAELAKDLAQDALTRVWEKWEQCREPGSFLGYATMILLNTIREHYRQNKRRMEARDASLRSDSELNESEMEHPDDAPDESTLQRSGDDPTERWFADIAADEFERRMLEILQRCIKNTLQQRVLIELYFGERGYKEIAKELGLTITNVHVLRHRALDALRQCDAWTGFWEEWA